MAILLSGPYMFGQSTFGGIIGTIEDQRAGIKLDDAAFRR
jgi:hypothetical protein